MSEQLPPDETAAPPPGPPTETPDAPAVTPTPSTTNVRSWLVAGGVAAVLAVGAGFVLGGGGGDDGGTADAQNAAATGQPTDAQGGGPVFSGGPGGGTAGTIAAIDGDTLTVESDDGTATTVQTDDDTIVRETVEGSVDDLAEGDNVLVVGETDDDGNVTASNVVDNGDAELMIGGGPDGGQFPGGGQPPTDGQFPGGGELPDGAQPPDGGRFPGGGFPTSGSITSIDGDTLTIEDADGESVTVTLTDDTTVTVTDDLSVDDLEEGDTVRVMGETTDDVVDADVIQLGDGTFFAGGPQGVPPGAGVDTAGA